MMDNKLMNNATEINNYLDPKQDYNFHTLWATQTFVEILIIW